MKTNLPTYHHKISDKYYSGRIRKERKRVSKFGTFREKVQFHLVDRPPYAFGILTAADLANHFGYEEITVIEFGVSKGDGLKNLISLSEKISEAERIKIKVVGFDNGKGLPKLNDYRDHPEIWTEKDFINTNITDLIEELNGKAEIVIGEICDTLPRFIENLNSRQPVGFVSIDVDTFVSSYDALQLFLASKEKLLPVIPVYFDDIIGRPERLSLLFRNSLCGQMGAIREFNSKNFKRRYIDKIHNLKSRFPMDKENWLDMMYCLHVFDHSYRSTERRSNFTSVSFFDKESDLHWKLF